MGNWWRLWNGLRPIGRAGVVAIAVGLQMIGWGGEHSDSRFAVVGALIAVAGLATAALNRRPGAD